MYAEAVAEPSGERPKESFDAHASSRSSAPQTLTPEKDGYHSRKEPLRIPLFNMPEVRDHARIAGEGGAQGQAKNSHV